jgi:FMN-dependent NADH-azoreductase
MPGEANPSERESSVSEELSERFRDAYDDNGVDRSLIRWSLSLSPTQRVMAVEESLNALATVRRIDPPR